MKTIVKLRDGTTREFFPKPGLAEWHRGEVEGQGCLTIYACWNAGEYIGRIPVTSFGEGTWLEWLNVLSEPT